MEPCKITVKKARQIRDKGFFGSVKLYVQIDAGVTTEKTGVDREGNHEKSVWEESFQMLINPNDHVIFSVHDAKKTANESHRKLLSLLSF
jgi:hypothetical protein